MKKRNFYKEDQRMNRSQEKILLGTIITIIVGIVIVLVLAFQQRDKVNVISARIDDTRSILARLSNLYNKVLDHAGSVRTFVLSNDQSSLPTINSTADSILVQLSGLKTIYQGRTGSSDIDSLEKYLTRRIEHSNLIVNEAKNKGQAAAEALYETGHGREYNNQIFFITNRMQGNEMQMLSQQEASNSASIKSLTNYLVALLIIILVMTILIVWKIRTDLHERRIFNEKRKAEEELKKSESRYRSLIEQANDAIMITDEKGNFMDVNGSFCKQFGYTKEEMLKSNISLVMDPVSLAKDPVRFDLLMQGIPVFRERKMVRKDGTIIEVEANVKMLPDGRILAIARDITDRKKADNELVKSYREIRLLTKHLQKIREEERIHIAREIHDELGQQLTVLKMDASWLNKKLSGGDDSVKEKLKALLELLDETVNSVRRIASELRPSLLDDLGLVAAMEWHLKDFEKRSGVRVNFSADENDSIFSDEVKTGLFRILQESLTNVARHSSAKNVSVNFQKNNGSLILSIEDDGIGFDPNRVTDKKTLGILGMKERSLMMGGDYQITSVPDKGTAVVLTIPFSQK